jgi:hypothetical protein
MPRRRKVNKPTEVSTSTTPITRPLNNEKVPAKANGVGVGGGDATTTSTDPQPPQPPVVVVALKQSATKVELKKTATAASVGSLGAAMNISLVCLRMITEFLSSLDQAHCLFVNRHWRNAVPPDARVASLVTARCQLWNQLFVSGLVKPKSSVSSPPAKSATKVSSSSSSSSSGSNATAKAPKTAAKVSGAAAKQEPQTSIPTSISTLVAASALLSDDHRPIFTVLDHNWTDLVKQLRAQVAERQAQYEKTQQASMDATNGASITNKITTTSRAGGTINGDNDGDSVIEQNRLKLVQALLPSGESTDPLGLTRNLVNNEPKTLLSHQRYAHWLLLGESYCPWSWNKEQSRLAPLCGVYANDNGCALLLLPRLNDDRVPHGCGRFALFNLVRSRREYYDGKVQDTPEHWRGKVGFWSMHPSTVSIRLYPVCDSLHEVDTTQLAWIRLNRLDLKENIVIASLTVRPRAHGLEIGACGQVPNLPSMFFGTAPRLISSQADAIGVANNQGNGMDKDDNTTEKLNDSSSGGGGGDDDGWTSVTDSTSLALKQRRRANAAREKARMEEEAKAKTKLARAKQAAANKLQNDKLKSVLNNGTSIAAATSSPKQVAPPAAPVVLSAASVPGGGTVLAAAANGALVPMTVEPETKVLSVTGVWPPGVKSVVKHQQWYDTWMAALGGAKDSIKSLGCKPV